jgi:hypothetical protein
MTSFLWFWKSAAEVWGVLYPFYFFSLEREYLIKHSRGREDGEDGRDGRWKTF